MNTLREAAQQALAQLEINRTNFRKGPSKSICKMLAGGNDEVIEALKAALAEPQTTHSADCYKWHHQCAIAEVQRLRAALAEPCPCGDKPADQCPGEWKPGCDLGNNPKHALAEPVQESPVAETATTQQPIEQTPPSEYRRGYWAGFAIGKREGHIEAEDALAEPVQKPVAWRWKSTVNGKGLSNWMLTHGEPTVYAIVKQPLYTAPPRCPNCASLEAQNSELDRKLAEMEREPLSEEEIWRAANEWMGSDDKVVNLARAIEAAHGIIETKIQGDKDD